MYEPYDLMSEFRLKKGFLRWRCVCLGGACRECGADRDIAKMLSAKSPEQEQEQEQPQELDKPRRGGARLLNPLGGSQGVLNPL